MSTEARLAEELERRLTEVETVEATDPVHAKLGSASLGLFLGVVAVIAVGSWLAGAL